MYAGKCEHTKYQLEDLNSHLHLPLKSVTTLLKLFLDLQKEELGLRESMPNTT